MTINVRVKHSNETYQFENIDLNVLLSRLFNNQEDEVEPLTIERAQEILAKYEDDANFKLLNVENGEGYKRRLGLSVQRDEDSDNLTVVINNDEYVRGTVTKKNRRNHYGHDIGYSLAELLEKLHQDDLELNDLSSEQASLESSPSELSPVFSMSADESEVEFSPSISDDQPSEFIEAKNDETKAGSVDAEQDKQADETLKSSFFAKIKDFRLPRPNFSSMLEQVKWPSLSAASVALAARILGAGRLLFLGLGSMTLPLVTGVSFVASFAAQYLREAFKRSSHEQVLAPQDANESVIDKLAAMDEATWQSVKHGFEAQKGVLNQFKACARPSDWLHTKAYYAGYRQAEINPELDVNTIEASRKEKLKSA